MKETIKWGILGTGTIAKKFCTGLTSIADAEIYAVGSRSQESADRFAQQFSIPKAYASYEALANDPDVDVIYIATPHTLHMEKRPFVPIPQQTGSLRKALCSQCIPGGQGF